MKKTALKILSLIGAIFCAVFSLFSTTAVPVVADDVPTDYTKTKVLDDLSDVSTALYPKNPLGVLQVIRFQEYCYSEKSFYEMYYGLFVYIYNPTEVPLKTERNFNKLNMATAYDEDGQPTKYDNVRLTYCDDVSNRIYKFYVSDSSSILKTAKAYAKEHGRRRYDIAGIQLTHTDGTFTDSETKDRKYGYTYYFEGYAATCDINNSDAESTLKCTREDLETIELDVHQTNYRTEEWYHSADLITSEDGNYCDELNTVYFSIPNDIFEKYGNLQKIKAEWYEYKTRPVFVTSDENVYKGLKEYLGVDIGRQNDDLEYAVFWERKTTADGFIYKAVYNGETSANEYDYVNRMDWLIWKDGAESKADFKVSKEEMSSYAKWYSEYIATDAEKIVGANGEYSVKLFEDSIDADRLSLVKEHNKNATSGYVCQEIDAGDKGSLLLGKNQSFFDKLWNGVEYEEKGYDPIIVLDDSHNLGVMDSATFSSEYLVNAEEAEEVLTYCREQIGNDSKAVLFRFATTQYYASTAYFDDLGNIFRSNADGYVAQETVFLNFDVISLTFRSEEGADVVIGCVADPIDIINGLDAPPDLDNSDDDKWALIAGLILGVIALVFVIFIILRNIPTLGSAVLEGVGKWFKSIGQATKNLFSGSDKNGKNDKGGKK